MRSLGRKLLLSGGLLLAALCLGLLGWRLLVSDRFLDGIARPCLQRYATSRLQAEVQAERLVWQDGGLNLAGLRVARVDRYRFSLDRLRVIPSLAGLLRRHLPAVEILNPRLEVIPSPASNEVFGIPAEPPLTIGRLTVRGGSLAYLHAGHPLVMQDISFSMHGEAAFAFVLSASLRGRDAIPMESRGTGRWHDGIRLALSVLNWQGRSLLRKPVLLSLPAGRGKGHLQFSVAFGRISRGDVQVWLEALSLALPLPDELDFAVDDVRVCADWRPTGLAARLRLGPGLVRWPKLALPLASLTLDVTKGDGLWRGGGNFVLDPETTGELAFEAGPDGRRGNLTLTVTDPVALQERILGRVPAPVAGAVRLEARGELSGEAPAVFFAVRGGPGKRPRPGALLDVSELTLQGQLARSPRQWRVDAVASLAGGKLATLNGTSDQMQVAAGPVSWSRLRRLLPPARRPAWLQDAQGLTGEATLQRDRRGWTAEALLQADRVATLHGGLRTVVLKGRLLAEDGRLAFSSCHLRGRVVHRQGGEGDLRARFDAVVRPDGGWDARIGDLDFGPLEWMRPDGLAGLTGGRLHLEGRICRADRTSPTEMLLHGRVAVEEALWGAWYGELRDLPLDFRVFAGWDPRLARLELIDLKLDAGSLVVIRGEGQRHKARLSLQGRIQIDDLNTAWNGNGRVLLRELRPVLADLDLHGGAEVRFALDGEPGQWRLAGTCRLRDLSADWPRARLSAQGVRGLIPLDLALPAGRLRDVPLRRARLDIDRLAWGPVRLTEATVPLAVSTNRMLLSAPLELNLGGGKVGIRQLQAGYAESGPQLLSEIRMEGIDLQTLTADLGMVPMEGEVNADLGRISYVGGVLRSDGEVLLKAFDGELRMRNLQLDPFSLGLPQLQADITFAGIDLYRLTRTFAFGAVNGVVDGRLDGLRLYGTTPSHFTGQLQTRLDGRRNISVKALNNLSILSQGGLSAALSRGVYRFIDFYRYRRIGVRCELAEDVFTLRGVARPGSERYLVDGGLLPPKIDILAPAQPISFREMLRRLQRLDRAGRGGD